MGPDLSVVELHLRAILTEAHGRVPLARLGSRLREVLPGFSAEAYGFPTLKALLQQVTLPGRLVQRGPLDWWLVADGVGDPASSVVPASQQERSSAPGRTRVDKAWWKAITEFDKSRQAWFDLQTEQLTTNAELAAAEPERFLGVPRFDLEAQRALARTWSEALPSPAKEDCLAALDADPTLVGFLRATERAGLSPSWNQQRLDIISSALVQWGKAHGIEARTFSSLERVPPVLRQPTGAAQPRSSGMTVDELRHFLCRVIEEMSEPELMQIAVPARFLLRR